jgi:peptidyl-prolyl cis-trans isomerase C
MSSRTRFAALAALCLATFPGCQQSQQKLSKEVPALVNGAPITRAEVDRAAKALLSQNKIARPVAPQVLEKAAQSAVEQLIAAELLYQAGSKIEVPDLERQVRDRIAQSRSRYKTEAEYDKALGLVGMSQKEVEVAVRKDIVINNLIKTRFLPSASVSEEEIGEFYRENRDKVFRVGERVRVSQILVPVSEQASPALKMQAREKAQALLKRVQNGEDFAAVASLESAPPTNKDGGDMGVLARGEAVPSFEKAAFALKPGEVSGLVETPVGLHIIKMRQKLPPATARLDEARGQIALYLQQAKVRKSLAQYAAQLRAKAKVERI